MPVMHWIGLGVMGVALGALGTLIGAGGGFLLMPILALMYPGEAPEVLASISLGVVFMNATSGSVGYARLKMIDYRAGWMFMAAGIPGAIAGSLVTPLIPRREFDIGLGVVLVGIGGLIVVIGALRPRGGREPENRGTGEQEREGNRHGVAGYPKGTPGGSPVPRGPGFVVKGVAISFVVGFVSSLLGIGGGIIHVPAMVYALGFPVHTAAATSHFVLAGTALSGTAAHVVTGGFAHGVWRTLAIGIGAVVGAQIGARFAKRTPPVWILRGLGVALVLAGARVVWVALG
jgi:uncharacterized membrane protein YfcA